MRKNSQPTIKDVAKAAGVSIATVSYVLNKTPGHTISLGTRFRVLEVTRELGYVPNVHAQTLGKEISGEISHIIFEPVLSYGMLEWLALIQEGIESLGYLPGSYIYFGKSTEAMVETYMGILARRPAAVISSKLLMTNEIYEYSTQFGVKACIIYNPTQLDYGETIIIPYRKVGKVIGKHLLERGHRRIAFIKPTTSNNFRIEVSKECLKGMKSVKFNEDFTITEFSMEPNLESANKVLDQIINTTDKPTAIFGFTDDYCLPLHKAIQERGLRMPDDFALVGSEDTELSNFVSPSLTAARIDVRALSYQAVNRADALIRETEPDKELFDLPKVLLNIRETS